MIRMRHIPRPQMKVVYVVLAVVFLMLGVIGLVLPIIPGLLFLAGAVYLLGKVSRRVRNWSHRNETYRHFHNRLDRLGEVNATDRVRIVGLMCVDGMVRAADAVTAGVGRVCRVVRRTTV